MNKEVLMILTDEQMDYIAEQFQNPYPGKLILLPEGVTIEDFYATFIILPPPPDIEEPK